MAQNSFILDDIDHEAMKALADAHHQNWLPGNDIPIKTTEAFLTIAYEFYLTISERIAELRLSVPENFLTSCPLHRLPSTARPIVTSNLQVENLCYLHGYFKFCTRRMAYVSQLHFNILDRRDIYAK